MSRADVEVTAAEIEVWLWTGRPVHAHQPHPPLAALAIRAHEAHEAAGADLGLGSRILLERDRYAVPAASAVSPCYGRVRAVGPPPDHGSTVTVIDGYLPSITPSGNRSSRILYVQTPAVAVEPANLFEDSPAGMVTVDTVLLPAGVVVSIGISVS